MKARKTKKRKYGVGGSVNSIQNPSTALVDAQTAKATAQYEAQTDPTANIMKMLGGLGIQAGGMMGGPGAGAAQQLVPGMETLGQLFAALGGTVGPPEGVSTDGEAVNFMQNWLLNPTTNNRLKSNLDYLGKDSGESEEILSESLDKVKGTSISHTHRDEGAIGAEYNKGHIDVHQAGEGNAETLAHELTHAGGMDEVLSKFITSKYGSPFANYRDKIAAKEGYTFNDETSKFNKGDESISTLDLMKKGSDTELGFAAKKNHLTNYLGKNGEVYPRIQEMRKFLGVQPGDEIGPEQIEQLKGDKDQSYMFDYYEDQTIQDILNEVASSSGTNEVRGMAALGGTIGNNSVEVEGKEAFELPNGIVGMFEGPSHEAGGIDTELPSGTDIFSKRVKGEDGKSMAVRKMAREKAEKKIAKYLEAAKGDKLLKKSLKRTQENNEALEEKDKATQELVSQIMGEQQKFAFGSGVDGIDPIAGFIPEGTDIYSDPNKSIAGNKLQDLGRLFQQGAEGVQTPSVGDISSILGNLYNTFNPENLVEKQRAGDTPNINAFEDYGVDALAANDKAKGEVKRLADSAKQDLETSKRGTVNRIRKSSRGINQMRAGELAANQQANNSIRDIYASQASQLAGLFSQQASLENQQDGAVMQGEAVRDDNDRKDRDNYYTQLLKAQNNKGEGLQELGKNLNTRKANTETSGILNQLFDNYEYDYKTKKFKVKTQ